MKKKSMSKQFKVVNIVAVQNCGFHIRLSKVWKNPACIKILEDRYDKQYTYIQPIGAKKQTTIFYNGNMINIGNTKISHAKRDLNLCKKFLKKFKIKEATA